MDNLASADGTSAPRRPAARTPHRIILAVAIAAAGLLGFAEWHAMQSAGRAPLLLTGERWRQMSTDAKVAFVREVVDTQFDPFVLRWLQGSFIDVVRQVDRYYEAHADQLERPVVETIFPDGGKSR